MVQNSNFLRKAKDIKLLYLKNEKLNWLTYFRDTWNKDGLVRGLYAGTSPSLIANIAENSILFAANGVCQKFLARMSGKTVENLSPLENGISGFLAAFWSSLALCPTELVKCRLQAMREAHAEKGLEPPKIGPLKLTQQILRSEGPRGKSNYCQLFVFILLHVIKWKIIFQNYCNCFNWSAFKNANQFMKYLNNYIMFLIRKIIIKIVSTFLRYLFTFLSAICLQWWILSFRSIPWTNSNFCQRNARIFFLFHGLWSI